jgi:hypothetical protein
MATRTYDAYMAFQAREREEMQESSDVVPCKQLRVNVKDLQIDDLVKYAKQNQQMVVTEPVEKIKVGRRVAYIVRGVHYVYATGVVLQLWKDTELSVLRIDEDQM